MHCLNLLTISVNEGHDLVQLAFADLFYQAELFQTRAISRFIHFTQPLQDRLLLFSLLKRFRYVGLEKEFLELVFMFFYFGKISRTTVYEILEEVLNSVK